MRLWRIADTAWATDLSGEGARRFGGRWNPIGVAVVYAATTPELSAMEKLVHLSRSTKHPAMTLVAIDVPDDAGVFQPGLDALPARWNDQTNFQACQQFGNDWIRRGSDLCMLVPSIIVPESRNAVLNIAHPRFGEVTATAIRAFQFDTRLQR
jgi:RES domain-containing protein